MSAKTVFLGQIGDYEIRHLRVFMVVADCGGFSAAESTLNISRPTISIHIANLEARLNMRLCTRGRAGFSLTEEGEIVYEQASRLLTSLEGFRNTINKISSSPTGRLKVTLSDTLSLDPRCRVPEIIGDFCRQAPDVELITDVDAMNEIERRVLNGDLDIGFIPYHRPLEGLVYTHLFTETNYLYCSSRNPLFGLPDSELSEDRINHARLVHAGLYPHQQVSEALSDMDPVGTAYFYESRIAMVLSGEYVGFLPEAVATPYVKRGELKALSPGTRSYGLGVAVISRKGDSHSGARDLFLETIKSAFPDASSEAPY